MKQYLRESRIGFLVAPLMRTRDRIDRDGLRSSNIASPSQDRLRIVDATVMPQAPLHWPNRLRSLPSNIAEEHSYETRDVLQAGGIICRVLLALSAIGIVDHAHEFSVGHPPPNRRRPPSCVVHGAFTDSSSWDGVIAKLQADGYTVIAAPTRFRGLTSDSEYIARVVTNVKTPVVLVGHSYGGDDHHERCDRHRQCQSPGLCSSLRVPKFARALFDLTAKFPEARSLTRWPHRLPC